MGAAGEISECSTVQPSTPAASDIFMVGPLGELGDLACSKNGKRVEKNKVQHQNTRRAT